MRISLSVQRKMEWSNNSSSHDSRSDFSGIEAYEALPFLAATLLIILSNAFVVQLILRKRALRTASNTILAGLALSDLLMGALGVPLVFTCNAVTNVHGICASSAIVVNFISYSTVAHIFLHTCDRYIYMSQALRYSELMPKSRVYKLLALTWGVTLTASCVKSVWVIGVDLEDEAAVQRMQLVETRYGIFTFVAFFCLPLVAIVVMDFRMMRLVHHHSVLMCLRNIPSNAYKRSVELAVARKRKSVLSCVLVLAVYIVCWFPYFFLEWLDRMVEEDSAVTVSVFWLLYYIRFASSVCNPWLYTLRKKDLKRAACSRVRRSQHKPIHIDKGTLHPVRDTFVKTATIP